MVYPIVDSINRAIISKSLLLILNMISGYCNIILTIQNFATKNVSTWGYFGLFVWSDWGLRGPRLVI